MTKNSKDIVITSAFRTPIGSYMGSLSDINAVELGTEIIKNCMINSELNGDDVDMVYMGQVLQTGSGQNPARQSAMNAGINKEKTATTINQVCGSGLAAISLGYSSLKLGDENIIIAAHGNSIRSLCKYIFEIDDTKISRLEIPTGNPLVLNFENQKLKEAKDLDKERAKDLLVF